MTAQSATICACSQMSANNEPLEVSQKAGRDEAANRLEEAARRSAVAKKQYGKLKDICIGAQQVRCWQNRHHPDRIPSQALTRTPLL